MPEHPTPRDVASIVGRGEAAGTQTLADRLAAATLATPGVLHLVPTLKNALRQLRSGARNSQDAAMARATQSPSGQDGVTLAGVAPGSAVTIDIAVTGQASALETALAVQAAVAKVLLDDHVSSPRVRVNVLEIEPRGGSDPTIPLRLNQIIVSGM